MDDGVSAGDDEPLGGRLGRELAAQHQAQKRPERPGDPGAGACSEGTEPHDPADAGRDGGLGAAVLGAFGIVSMTVVSVLAFLVAQLILGAGSTASLGDGTVLRAVLGVGVYLGLVGLIGVALGWIIRSTAGAVGAVTGLVFVAPGLALLLPEGFQGATKFLPSSAGEALMSTVPTDALLTPVAGLGVLALWVAVPLTVAAVLVRRRDV